jgi:NADH-quinone oxidoreductase subunit L
LPYAFNLLFNLIARLVSAFAGVIKPYQVRDRLELLYQLSYHKFYIDEAYAWLNRHIVNGFGRLLAWVDIHLVDGLVNLLALTVRASGAVLRRTETGQLQHYALVFFGAALVILLWITYAGHSLAMAWIGGGVR